MINKLNYENVLHVLTDNLNTSEKQSEREIAKALLVNFNSISELSIEKLAERCYISQPTLTRYIKRLGYTNYNEFKDFVVEFKGVLANEVNSDIFLESSQNIVDISFKQLHNSTNKTHKLLNKKLLNQVVEQIKCANKVVIIGIDYSQIVAFDAQLRFMRYNKLMETAVKIETQKRLVENLADGDLLIVLSVSGFTKGLQKACKSLNSNVNTVIISSSEDPVLLTGHEKRLVLNITPEANLNVNSSLSGRINLLLLIDCLYLLYGRKYYLK